jgi:geranylgeranyl diphosphate synthase type I
MHGGADKDLITLITGVIEGLHAYMLVIDDIADHARTRRGNPTAHIRMERYLTKHQAAGDVKQTASDMAISGALTGQHKAQVVLAKLPIQPEYKQRIIEIVNERLIRTGLGQILDIASTTGIPMDIEIIKSIALSKTAYYTFQMPLETGAVLAGAPDSSIQLLKNYALHAGFAFQLQDDIMGVFGDEKKMGKSAKSDIMEGKQTLLLAFATEAASRAQKDELRRAMGNQRLTDKEFKRCQDIIVSTGALNKVGIMANDQVALAHEVLDNAPTNWPTKNVEYLRELASFAADREI